mgnify:CR=1 FL=1
MDIIERIINLANVLDANSVSSVLFCNGVLLVRLKPAFALLSSNILLPIK